jgi:hypothetical protein
MAVSLCQPNLTLTDPVQIVMEMDRCGSMGVDCFEQCFNHYVDKSAVFHIGDMKLTLTQLHDLMVNTIVSVPDFNFGYDTPGNFLKMDDKDKNKVVFRRQISGTFVGKPWSFNPNLHPVLFTQGRRFLLPVETGHMTVKNGKVVDAVVDAVPGGGPQGAYVLMGGHLPPLSNERVSDNVKLLQKFLSPNSRDLTTYFNFVDSLFHRDFLFYTPGAPKPMNRDGFVNFIRHCFAAFPDLTFGMNLNSNNQTPVCWAKDGSEVDTVILQCVDNGTHTGCAWNPLPELLPAIPITNKKVVSNPESWVVTLKNGQVIRAVCLTPDAGPLRIYQLLGGTIPMTLNQTVGMKSQIPMTQSQTNNMKV